MWLPLERCMDCMKYLLGAFVLVFGFVCGDLRADGSGFAPLETNLTFRVSGTKPGVFGIVRPAADATSAVRYRLDSGTVEFTIADRIGDSLDNPLFCFDYDVDRVVRLAVQSMGRLPALPGLGLSYALQYSASGSQIAFSPAASTQCFYFGAGADPEFGLFGVAPATSSDVRPGAISEPPIFIDSFEAEAALEIAFEFDVFPGASRLNEIVSYRLVVRNTGQTDFDSVSFQEIVPANRELYPIALEGGTWSCTGCPSGQTAGIGGIRFERLAIAAGGEVRFNITRLLTGTIPANGGSLRFYAGAVVGPGPNAVFDTAEAVFTFE